jgi:hypothetical protein
MTLPGRRLRAYHQRRSTKIVKLQKEQLADLERQISMDVGALLVLIEEGSAEQVFNATQKVRSDLLKYGPEMNSLATHMRGSFSKAVHDYLNTIDNIAKSSPGWCDEEKIHRHYEATQKLQRLTRTTKTEGSKNPLSKGKS